MLSECSSMMFWTALIKMILAVYQQVYVVKAVLKYGFRYAIPKRGHNPLRLIDIQNSISINQVMLNAFKFGDIKSNHTFHYYL